MAPPPLALVLYGDPEHRYAPVGDFFYSAEAKELVSRALGASSAEVDSLYCPRALEPVAQSDADAAFGRSDACADCPRCGTTLRAVRDDTWHYACASCAWTSRAVDLEDGEDDLHLAMGGAARGRRRGPRPSRRLARLRASASAARARRARPATTTPRRALRDPLPEPLEARLRQPSRRTPASVWRRLDLLYDPQSRAAARRRGGGPHGHPPQAAARRSTATRRRAARAAGTARTRPRRTVGGRRPPPSQPGTSRAPSTRPSHAGAGWRSRVRRAGGATARPWPTVSLRAEPVARRRDDGNRRPRRCRGGGTSWPTSARRGGARRPGRRRRPSRWRSRRATIRRGWNRTTGAARARRRRPSGFEGVLAATGARATVGSCVRGRGGRRGRRRHAAAAHVRRSDRPRRARVGRVVSGRLLRGGRRLAMARRPRVRGVGGRPGVCLPFLSTSPTRHPIPGAGALRRDQRVPA